MGSGVLIHWVADGAEHDEHWPSIDAFLVWCSAEGLRVDWTAYEEDEDGEWLLISRSQQR